MKWNLSDAKNRLSEVLDRAGRDGPQTITRRGDVFVLLRAEEFERMTGKSASFADWLLKGPRVDDLELPRRDASGMRRVDLS